MEKNDVENYTMNHAVQWGQYGNCLPLGTKAKQLFLTAITKQKFKASLNLALEVN
jgi:hypothetical protein